MLLEIPFDLAVDRRSQLVGSLARNGDAPGGVPRQIFWGFELSRVGSGGNPAARQCQYRAKGKIALDG